MNRRVGDPATVVRTVPVDDDRSLLDLLPGPHALVWLSRGEGLVGWGEAARINPGSGPQRFSRAADRLAALWQDLEIIDEVGRPASGPVAFASFTFDRRAPGSVVIVPRVLVAHRDGMRWLTTVGKPPGSEQTVSPPPTGDDRIRYAGSSNPDLGWLAAVATAIRRIEAGELDKVVLARDHAVWSRSRFDPRVLARRLTRRFPGCFTFLCDGLVGATPELLIRRVGPRIESLILAGSAPRGVDQDHDERLGRTLVAADKERREHHLAVTSVRDVLAARCERLSMDDQPQLLRLANVQHLATRACGELTGTPTALELAGALHPTGAVGGVPTAAAMTAIRELEGMDRGRYAGPVGWVDARGDGEFGIALRCAELSGARARLFAGAGIVRGSLPEDELEETRVKLKAMQSAFEP